MSNCVLPQPFEAFKKGLPEAYRHYFDQHCPRIYYYLLRQTKDRAAAKRLAENTFIALYRSTSSIADENQLLRRLYLIARVSMLLYERGRCSARDLFHELTFYTHAEEDILDDPEIAGNESLLALQEVIQRLPAEQLTIAELFFFQGLPARSIARFLGVNEERVKENLTLAMQRLNEELAERIENRRAGWRLIPALAALTGGYAA